MLDSHGGYRGCSAVEVWWLFPRKCLSGGAVITDCTAVTSLRHLLEGDNHNHGLEPPLVNMTGKIS